MANRHLARSLAMQALYEWDFAGKETERIDEIAKYVMEEFGPGLEDAQFVYDIVRGVVAKIEQIDAIIERAAPEWPIDQIAMVDRNVLRVGIFELLFGDRNAVPPKVAINESIELAKSFGGENSGKFINGVLGTIYREIGEPMKEHVKGQADPNLQQEDLVGGVLVRREKESYVVAWLKDKFGYWTFPKGHVEAGGDMATALCDGIKNELNISDINVRENAGEVSYISKSTAKGKSRRVVNYFIAETKTETLEPTSDSELSEALWVPLADVPPGDYYHDLDAILATAREILAA